MILPIMERRSRFDVWGDTFPGAPELAQLFARGEKCPLLRSTERLRCRDCSRVGSELHYGRRDPNTELESIMRHIRSATITPIRNQTRRCDQRSYYNTLFS